jgi:hypothetical protein
LRDALVDALRDRKLLPPSQRTREWLTSHLCVDLPLRHRRKRNPALHLTAVKDTALLSHVAESASQSAVKCSPRDAERLRLEGQIVEDYH